MILIPARPVRFGQVSNSAPLRDYCISVHRAIFGHESDRTRKHQASLAVKGLRGRPWLGRLHHRFVACYWQLTDGTGNSARICIPACFVFVAFQLLRHRHGLEPKTLILLFIYLEKPFKNMRKQITCSLVAFAALLCPFSQHHLSFNAEY